MSKDKINDMTRNICTYSIMSPYASVTVQRYAGNKNIMSTSGVSNHIGTNVLTGVVKVISLPTLEI